jgi:hypothetical protein
MTPNFSRLLARIVNTPGYTQLPLAEQIRLREILIRCETEDEFPVEVSSLLQEARARLP